MPQCQRAQSGSAACSAPHLPVHFFSAYPHSVTRRRVAIQVERALRGGAGSPRPRPAGAPPKRASQSRAASKPLQPAARRLSVRGRAAPALPEMATATCPTDACRPRGDTLVPTPHARPRPARHSSSGTSARAGWQDNPPKLLPDHDRRIVRRCGDDDFRTYVLHIEHSSSHRLCERARSNLAAFHEKERPG